MPFLFVGDLNGYHQMWLSFKTTNRHGVAAVPSQLRNCACLRSVGCRPDPCTWCNTIGLLMTDVPDLVGVAVIAPIGNSDHSSLSAVISMGQAVPN